MGRRKKRALVNVDEVVEFFNNIMVEKPYLPLLIPLILIFWAIEKWFFSLSNWVPLVLAVWATVQYGNYQHRIVVEDLNKKWKRVILSTSPTTPLEHCEWLNKLLMEIWPNYMNPKLSLRFQSIVEKRLKHRKSRLIEKLELLEFSLGSCPPCLGLQGTRWSTSGDQRVMRLGFDWDTTDISIMLLAKVAKPFFGTAKIVINSLHIKGDLLLMPILDGKAILYSFISTPEVRITVAFGSGGSQSLPATELPGVSSWLVKLLTDTLAKTMVEPRRQCFSLPPVDLRKKAVGGIIYVTVKSASKLSRSSLRGSPSRRQPSFAVDGLQERFDDNHLQTFVEVELGELTRRTDVRPGSNPQWDSTFNMVLHDSAGAVRFHLYERTPGSVKYDYLASCEVKIKYVSDDSTTFWAVGPDSGVIARHSEFCGKEVEMVLPFEGVNAGELAVRLVVKEWQFSDGSLSFNKFRASSQPSLNGSSNFLSRTGRKINVTIVEGKDLITKDKFGKCNPYIKLQYGKALQKTRTAHSINPTWNQKFEFDEIGGGEYLKIKCYTEEVFGDDSIGSARVSLEGLVEGSVRDVWVPLEKVNSGELRIQIEAIIIDDCEGSRGSSTGNGWIELVLIEARDLIAADLRGTSDPYVRVQYGNLKRRTKVMYKTLNPKWHQTLEFPDDGSPLELHVKDHNAVLPTSSIGDCVVEYQRLPPNEMSDKWIPLQGVKRGEIHVQVTRKVPELQKRASLDPEPSLTKAHRISSQMKQMMIKLQSLVEDSNLEGLPTSLSELETLQDMQEEYMVQLEMEQMLLLNKIKELGQEILNSPPSLSRRSSGS
ncbi:C2 calcium-dependent membrane targeting [Corchorus capsularis]|uniref:C2 calcium-dependent membrane targeting n=1 Tax=Corchorus capsularis TaxID=210143 RepID=A0A1R3IX22_COCAP|nr:C2 calcium-dependent membrane targeting [Corchorus capsularis]